MIFDDLAHPVAGFLVRHAELDPKVIRLSREFGLRSSEKGIVLFVSSKVTANLCDQCLLSCCR